MSKTGGLDACRMTYYNFRKSEEDGGEVVERQKKDRIITIRLDAYDEETIRREAERRGMGVSTLIRTVVREYIKSLREKEKGGL